MTLVVRHPRSMGSHQRPNHGTSVEWLTPPKIINALGPFDLDPCCPQGMPWHTATNLIIEPEDGLAADWPRCCRVWLNPPYGASALGPWLEKLAHHGNGIALVFARTETKAFREQGWNRASAMLFLRGRLHFHRIDGSRAPSNAGAPSVLIAYGWGNVDRLQKSGIDGKFVRLT